MNITRYNYEEFFMLYADNELAAAARKEVEAFIAANPGMEQELVFFQQSKLQPDDKLLFPGKQALLKQEAAPGTISLENYTSFFVLYGDDELDNDQKAGVEDFVYRHPQTQVEFEQLLQSRLRPDNSIVFENKEILYRKEEDDRVVPFRWWRLAVAAMVLLMAGAFWLYQSAKNKQSEIVQQVQPANNQQQQAPLPEKIKPVLVPGNKEQAVKEVLAAADDKKDNRQVNSVAANPATGIHGKKPTGKSNATVEKLQNQDQPEVIAVVTPDKLKATAITAITKENTPKVEVNRDLAAARPITDQQINIPNTNEDNKMKVEWASANSNDNVEVLNTSVNTKNSMRGFLRKASRLIAKKTSVVDGDGNRKGILIGGFEIAVR